MKSHFLRHDGSIGRVTKCIALSLFGMASLGFSSPSWTQWGGPNRDFTVDVTGLADKWPEDGPRRVWSRELGDGFATIISDGEAAFAMYRAQKESKESVIALNLETGKTIWEHQYDAPFITKDEKNKQPGKYGFGPNATPLLVDGRLYTIGYTSIMHCLDAKSGKVIWSHDLYKDFDGSFLVFGYAASPIEYRDTIIVLVGGKGHGVVAFDKATGKVKWKSTDFAASFSSPIMIDVDGQDHLVAFMDSNIAGLDPKTGELHWSIEHKNQWGTSICTPVSFSDNRLYFCVAGDTAGGRVVRLAKKDGKIAPKDVWTNKKIRGSLNNPIRIGDRLYGGNDNKGAKYMIGVNLEDGKILWKDRSVPGFKGVYADEKLFLLDEDGNLMLATANSDGVKIHSKVKLLENPAWSAPTLVGTKLLLRDKKTIVAVDVGYGPGKPAS